VSTPSKPVPWMTNLSQESKLGRAQAGGHLPSLANTIVQHEQLSVFSLILNRIDAECKRICQTNVIPPSLFRKIPSDKLSEVTWQSCIDELHAKAPLLLQVLSKVVFHSDHRNQKKANTVHYPSICMVAAIILKDRSKISVGYSH